MEHRNRATGWKHAKLSGHDNETLVKDLLDSDGRYASNFLKRIGCPDKVLAETKIGGLRETNVESVIPNARKTKSKTDLKLFYAGGGQTNISIKKSLGGQVYLVSAGVFVECFQCQFGKRIPKEVVRAIDLFWANAEDAVEIIKKHGDQEDLKVFDMQLRHGSLNATTLLNYDKSLHDALLYWFADNAQELTRLCFASGAVKDRSEWSDFVWYKNMLGENDIDEVFQIERLCKAAARAAHGETCFGLANGGTTIQLPFGFVEWHQRKLQFHHSFEKISTMEGN